MRAGGSGRRGQDPFLNTFFPNYADLVTDESVGPCPELRYLHPDAGNCAQPAVRHQVEGQLLQQPPGPAQAEFEVLLTEGSNTLSVIYGATGDNGLTAVSGIQQDLNVFTSFSCDEAVADTRPACELHTHRLWQSHADPDGDSYGPRATATATATATPTAHGHADTCTALQAACVRGGQGYWKNHPDQWPVTELQLGNVTYDQQQLLDILHQPVQWQWISFAGAPA